MTSEPFESSSILVTPPENQTDVSPCLEVAAQKQGFCNSEFQAWVVNFALANTSQTMEHCKQICSDGQCFPAVLRRSTFVCMVRRRVITVPELWLVQGYGYPGLAPERAAQGFALREVLRTQSRSAQRSLIGNAMHLGQIGTWLLWACLAQRMREP